MKKADVAVGNPSMSNLKTSPPSEKENLKLCWSCQSSCLLEDTICPSCQKIQKPIPFKNAFAFFGLDVTFPICLEDLEKRYCILSQRLHPDAFLNSSLQEKTYATELIAFLNKAYALLKDPFQRGFHILALNKQESCLSESKLSLYNDELLEEIIEAQERLEEVSEDEEKNQLIEEIFQKQKNVLYTIQKAFEKDAFQAAEEALYRYHYYGKFLIEARRFQTPNHNL